MENKKNGFTTVPVNRIQNIFEQEMKRQEEKRGGIDQREESTRVQTDSGQEGQDKE